MVFELEKEYKEIETKISQISKEMHNISNQIREFKWKIFETVKIILSEYLTEEEVDEILDKFIRMILFK
ncbi:MAG: hypothetical protein ACE5KE_00605 [Methanosarcinales archaeon]